MGRLKGVEVVSALDLVMTVMQKFLDTTLTADTNEMTLLDYIETHAHECLLNKKNQSLGLFTYSPTSALFHYPVKHNDQHHQ